MLSSLKSMPLVRIATNDKVIDSRPLNLLGVQILRILTARLLYRLIPVSVADDLKASVDELRSEGITLWPNFLPPDRFEGVRQECLQLLQENRAGVTVHQSGPNAEEWVLIRDSHFDGNALPFLRAFFADERLKGILEAAEKKPLSETTRHEWRTIQHLIQGPLGGEADYETELHSDVFFNTHKGWLYLEDVGLENGPFVYVKRSHRLSPTQLYYAYRESCGRNKGSRRISPEELERRGLEETTVTCPKNTLVIANTAGYHRRSRGEPGRHRYALHIYLRGDPFLWWLRRDSAKSEISLPRFVRRKRKSA